MNDRLNELRFYSMAMCLWDDYWKDSEILLRDIRGKEIARQMTRSISSIAANIEEGFGRGSRKEYSLFLKYARGSARESIGWYLRSRHLLRPSIIEERISTVRSILAMLTNSIQTLDKKGDKT